SISAPLGLPPPSTLPLHDALPILLFVILLYVYPLKFMYTVIVRLMSGRPLVAHLPGGATVPMIDGSDVPRLYTVYHRHSGPAGRSEEHTSELQSLRHLVCRLLLEK